MSNLYLLGAIVIFIFGLGAAALNGFTIEEEEIEEEETIDEFVSED